MPLRFHADPRSSEAKRRLRVLYVLFGVVRMVILVPMAVYGLLFISWGAPAIYAGVRQLDSSDTSGASVFTELPPWLLILVLFGLLAMILREANSAFGDLMKLGMRPFLKNGTIVEITSDIRKIYVSDYQAKADTTSATLFELQQRHDASLDGLRLKMRGVPAGDV